MCSHTIVSGYLKRLSFSSTIKYVAYTLIAAAAMKKIIEIIFSKPSDPPKPISKAVVISPPHTQRQDTSHSKKGSRQICIRANQTQQIWVIHWDRIARHFNGKATQGPSFFERFVWEGHCSYLDANRDSNDKIIGTLYFASVVAYWVERDILNQEDVLLRASRLFIMMASSMKSIVCPINEHFDMLLSFAVFTAKRLFFIAEKTRGSAHEKAYRVYQSILIEGVTAEAGHYPFPIRDYQEVAYASMKSFYNRIVENYHPEVFIKCIADIR